MYGRVVDDAFGQMGRIDVVVNNAGYGLFGAAEELSEEEIRLQLDTNVIGSISVTRAASPHLRVQGGGRILQMSSMGGQIALPGLSLNHASKWAIEGFFEAVIHEVADFNIKITLIEPSGARTEFEVRAWCSQHRIRFTKQCHQCKEAGAVARKLPSHA